MEQTMTSKIKNLFSSLEQYKEVWINDQLAITSGKYSRTMLSREYDTHFHDSWIEYHNSVKNETIKVEGLKFIYGLYNEDDILIENGMVMKNGRRVFAPTVESEIYLFNRRKQTKKKGNYYLTEGNDPVLGAIFDNLQKNIKILMNTYYGVLTNPYSVFYNRDLGDSITCRGRSSIAVTALACEGAFAKKIPYEINALLYYFTKCYFGNIRPKVLEEMVSRGYTYEDVITEFHLEDHYALPYIKEKLKKLNPTDIAKIIHKNNFKLFITLPSVKSCMEKFYKLCIEHDTPYLDPNEPPSKKIDGKRVEVPGTQELIKELEEYTRDILTGMYWYGADYVPERNLYVNNVQEKIKAIDRQVIAIIDTDSNILSYENAYKAIEADLYENKIITNDSNFDEDNEFYSISNMCAIIVCEVIAESLVVYKNATNIMPEKWDCLRLKNEFLFKRMLLSGRKKHYLGVIKLKEGKPYPKPKLDIKGHEYKKSSVNATIGARVHSLVERIMMDEELNITDIMSKLRDYTKEIEDAHSTQNILDYCVTLKLKTKLENTDPSDYRYKAITLWNSIAENDGEKIDPPAAFYKIPIELKHHEDIAKVYPEKMEKIYKWLNDRNVSMIKLQIENILEDSENSKYGFIKALTDTYSVDEIQSVDDWVRIRKNMMQLKKNNKLTFKTCDLSYLNIEDINNIAFPITLTTVPQFILDLVEPMDNKILMNSLIASMIGELHLTTPRNSKSKRLVTNIIDRF